MTNQTSLWTAYSRALESEKEDPLFVDQYAKPLLEYFFGNDYLHYESLAKNPYLLVRTKYFDSFIVENYRGCDQIVILGAGLDARKLRLNLSKVSVFEIDNKEIMEKKNKFFAGKEGWFFIDSDVTKNEWKQKLVSCGFDKNKSTLWILEGLLFYLSEPDVSLLLHEIHQLSFTKSKIICDVFGAGLLKQKSMEELVKNRTLQKLPLPYCHDYPEKLLENAKAWEAKITYCGSKEANYGKVKSYVLDLDAPEQRSNNSFFVMFEKLN